ncbi:MAG TPA: DUF4139 domain-containing protein [Abditibacteriaceae bacterium]
MKRLRHKSSLPACVAVSTGLVVSGITTSQSQFVGTVAAQTLPRRLSQPEAADFVSGPTAASPPTEFQVAAGPTVGQTATRQLAVGPPLPLRTVVLFSSGVGYYERAGRVNGAGAFEIGFRPTQINDVLKSLVLFDPAGEVRPVAYSIEDFVARRPRSTDLAVNSGYSLGGLLRQFQGVPVRFETNAGVVEGRIVSVGSRQIISGTKEGVLSLEAATVLTATGLRVVSLDEVTQVKLLDERLDRKLRESLEKLAGGLAADLDDGQRAVQLHFAGRGEREVRAGYLQEAPVWKTSYRLVLDPNGKPYLQGWAQAENTTDEDWNGVHLSLISGRPVSFIQNLYQPLYISRPTVEPQILGSPLPQTYGETLEGRVTSLEARPAGGFAGGRGGGGGGAGAAPGGFPGASSNAAPMTPGLANRAGRPFMNSGNFEVDEESRRKDIAASADQLARSVAAQAQGAERGELFEYSIKQPVTLRRGQAAMVPIVSETIEGQKLSIFDAGDNVLRAVYGFRLRNTTGLHLSGGPITVFQDGIYAGDGQINNVSPGESRLISYAVDLDLVVGRENPRFAQNLVSVSAQSGVLQITHRRRREQIYTFRNKSGTSKTVVVQQPIETEAGWKLISPDKPAEKSPTHYRFEVQVAPNKTAELHVVSEQPVSQQVALVEADFDAFIEYARNTQVSAPLRAALQELVARRRKVSELAAQRRALEEELKAIDAEQGRIRSNMGQLDRNSALYTQYVTKLTAQEERIEKLRGEIARLSTAETAAQKSVRDFVDNITLD